MKNKSILVLVVALFGMVMPVFSNRAKAAQSSQYLLVCSWYTDSVLRYDGGTGEFVDIFASGGGLSRPAGLAMGQDGSLLVSSWGTNEILQFDSATGDFIRVFASGGGMDTPGQMTFGPDGNLYVSNINEHSVGRYNGVTGEFIDMFIPEHAGGLWYPNALTFGPDGNLYVGIVNGYKILRYDGVTGDYIDTFIGIHSSPHDLVFRPDGYLYVAKFQHDTVVRYDANTGAYVDTFAGGPPLENPTGIAFGPDGDLYVSGFYSHNVVRYDGVSGSFIEEFVRSGSGGLAGAQYLLFVPEPATPPVANADGPYSIYVGDTLTLDASGSTDPDDDIVSYMWDLDDDDGSFETDAEGQAIFDVNYAYLQSLGLLINYTYTIHLKVTDSEQQSDVAESTLKIEPKPVTVVAVDIKPGSCPNPVNVKSSGVLPIAILGTEDVNVIKIDPTSVRLTGVEPIRSGFEDVATPVSDTNDCNCITEGPDGFLDLTLKFKTQRIVEAIGDVNDGDVRVLTLTGVLFDPMPFETPIEGADCILIRGRHKPINPADINKDGVVNAGDFAIFAQNWLQSSIVDE